MDARIPELIELRSLSVQILSIQISQTHFSLSYLIYGHQFVIQGIKYFW